MLDDGKAVDEREGAVAERQRLRGRAHVAAAADAALELADRDGVRVGIHADDARARLFRRHVEAAGAAAEVEDGAARERVADERAQPGQACPLVAVFRLAVRDVGRPVGNAESVSVVPRVIVAQTLGELVLRDHVGVFYRAVA